MNSQNSKERERERERELKKTANRCTPSRSTSSATAKRQRNLLSNRYVTRSPKAATTRQAELTSAETQTGLKLSFLLRGGKRKRKKEQ